MNDLPNHPEQSSRRRFPRRPCSRRILVSYRDDDRRQLIHGRCLTVSEGGMGAVIDGYLQADQQVAIEFMEMGEEMFRTVRLEARVRYQDGFRHGFEFMTPQQFGPARLQQLLS
jgi:hypothetical protein